jgi:hypothetical protein
MNSSLLIFFSFLQIKRAKIYNVKERKKSKVVYSSKAKSYNFSYFFSPINTVLFIIQLLYYR